MNGRLLRALTIIVLLACWSGAFQPVLAEEAGTTGLDLVLVMDATAGMQRFFKPAADALDEFIISHDRQIGQGESQTPLRLGLLFFRDRKTVPNCDIGDLFHWQVCLTEDVATVSHALASAEEARCDSEEPAEPVYDALSRALQDPEWHEGYFRVVLLIGDSPPHPPSDRDKNPLELDVADINQMSQERNVRIIALKIGNSDKAEYKALALSSQESVRGYFRTIEPQPETLREALLAILNEEWQLLAVRNQAVEHGVAPPRPRL
jgi:hypothetical protein